MTVSAMTKPSSLATRIKLGEEPSVYQRNGYAMAIQTASMGPMKILLCTIALHLSHVAKISSLAAMADALIK